MSNDREALVARLADAVCNEFDSLSDPKNRPILEEVIADALRAALPEPQGQGEAVAGMVDRFLGWRLPDDFSPDCGIAFTPLGHPNCWPVGTSLLTATQAKAMFEYCLQGYANPAPTPSAPAEMKKPPLRADESRTDQQQAAAFVDGFNACRELWLRSLSAAAPSVPAGGWVPEGWSITGPGVGAWITVSAPDGEEIAVRLPTDSAMENRSATMLYKLAAALLAAPTAASNEAREKCPDCGRLKARNADDARAGDCDKWFAVRDKEAHEECARIAASNEGEEA